MPLDLGTTIYTVASITLVILIVVQLYVWTAGISSIVFLGATLITLLWSIALLFREPIGLQNFYVLQILEAIKNLAWFAMLLSLLGFRRKLAKSTRDNQGWIGLMLLALTALSVPGLLIFLILSIQFGTSEILFLPDYGGRAVIIGFLVSAIIGLMLLEQVVRNTRYHHQWHIKFLCLGLGIMFSYDIYMYSNGLLFDAIQINLWDMRGITIILAAPLIALSVVRTRREPLQVNVSRHLVFHTSVLIAAGVYLLLMSSVGYYIRSFSSEWSGLLQLVFWVVSLSFLAILLYSGRMRSLLRVYINRHLFSSKYDYREEWMKISQTLSQTSAEASLPERSIRALADIVDSPGGALWLSNDGTHFDQIAHMEMGWVENSGLTTDDYLVQQLQVTESVVDLSDSEITVEKKHLPTWLSEIRNAWLIIPLQLHDELLGFMILREPRVNFELNWEDHDLLTVAAQQTASYLAQMVAADKLTETRQFSAFNQVSAFVVHDIKTLNSQLSMMVTNADRHKANPFFIDDMISTTKHAVNKMSLLLQHFQSERGPDESSARTNLVNLIGDTVTEQTSLQPLPTFNCSESTLEVTANEGELKSAIKHIIQNAQEATPSDGRVEVTLSRENADAVISVEDTGKGMTQEFINTQLFRPFSSTKGLTGMGLGVFQSRATIRKYGGDITVSSKPGAGSLFLLRIPCDPIAAAVND